MKKGKSQVVIKFDESVIKLNTRVLMVIETKGEKARDIERVDCTLTVTRLEQPAGTELLNPFQVDRRYDLIVKGTADPDASHVTAKLHVGLSVYNETVTYSGMNWVCTVNHEHFGETAMFALLELINQCSAEDPPAIGFLPIGFKN